MTVEYTRDMELEYQRTKSALQAAEAAHGAVRRARDEFKDALGSLLKKCPQASGTIGAANWAIANAEHLIEFLVPFVQEGHE